MEAQLAEAMAMMQQHPELNTPENRQILHKLRYSMQGGGGKRIAVEVSEEKNPPVKGVLSLNNKGQLIVDLPEFRLTTPIVLDKYKGDGEQEMPMPRDYAFTLPDPKEIPIALILLVKNGDTAMIHVLQPELPEYMPKDYQLNNHPNIIEFKKIPFDGRLEGLEAQIRRTTQLQVAIPSSRIEFDHYKSLLPPPSFPVSG